MSEILEKEIPADKRYHFPDGIEEISHSGKWLIVSPLTANWIVLENDAQQSFLHLLYENNLEEALSKFDGNEEDAQWVVIQLEARHFESRNTRLKQGEASVHIYLTNECNMRCPHCYMFAGESFDDELNFEEISNAIAQLAKGGVKSIVFSGGEPLLNRHLSDHIGQANALGMTVEVLSNGTLWTEKFVADNAPYLSSVQISIDGFDEQTNSAIRGKGNFAKALKTVDWLMEHGVNTSVAMVPKWSENLKTQTPCYIKFAKDLIERYKDKPFDFNIVGELWEGRDINLSIDDRKQFKDIVLDIFREVFGNESEDENFIEYHRSFGLEENCAYGNLSIAANGEVYLCAQIQPLHSIGNIRTHSIEDLLRKSEIAKQASEISKLQPCADCAIRYVCGGDCRIRYFSYLDKGLIPTEDQVPERTCTQSYKESMYDLMIRTNERIFQ